MCVPIRRVARMMMTRLFCSSLCVADYSNFERKLREVSLKKMVVGSISGKRIY